MSLGLDRKPRERRALYKISCLPKAHSIIIPVQLACNYLSSALPLTHHFCSAILSIFLLIITPLASLASISYIDRAGTLLPSKQNHVHSFHPKCLLG